MNEEIAHRGPNDQGFYLDKFLSLGHRRLSILDLSKKGHQPMFYDNSNLVIIYNGEVYNFQELRTQLLKKGYKFKSNTDTEVILAAYKEWGFKCLNKFNGMFAFCIYDKKNNKLFIARDRLGVKPLYYYFDKKRFIFASEISPILKHNIRTQPNKKAIYDFLLYNRTENTNETFFENIYRFPKANYAVFDIKTKKLEFNTWWKYCINDNTELSYKEAQHKLKDLLRSSVNLRLISDVPVGTFLSGGLDSSVIATLINNTKRSKISTFSVVYPDFSKDESKYIDELTKFTSIRNKKITPTPKMVSDNIFYFIEKQGEPVPSPSPFTAYFLYKLAKESNTIVLLNGQGSDELFAGYHYFYGFYLKELLRNFRIIRFFKELSSLIVKNGRKIAMASLLFLYLPYRLKKRYFFRRSNIDKLLYRSITTSYLKDFYSCKSLKEALSYHVGYKLEHLLRWEDRNSMAFSTEGRVPFLDYRIVEFAFSLPSSFIIRDGRTKAILSEAMKNDIPSAIYNRTDKIGFISPEEEWIKSEEIKDIIQKLLIDEKPLCSKYVDMKKTKKQLEKLWKGKLHYARVIWRTLFLEIWLRIYFNKNQTTK